MGPVVPGYVLGGTTGFKRAVFLMELLVFVVESLGDSLGGSLGDSLRDSLGGSLGGSLGDSLRDFLGGSLEDSLGDSLESSFAAFLHSRDKASNASLIFPEKTSDYSIIQN